MGPSAQCYLGDGLRWEEIYELNKDVIEDTAKQHGFSSSERGWWIFPGTVIKIQEHLLVITLPVQQSNLTMHRYMFRH